MSKTLLEFEGKLGKTLEVSIQENKKVTSNSSEADKRKKRAIKSGKNKGKYYITNKEEAESAIRLRHHSKPPLSKKELDNLLKRAAKYAPGKAKAARKKDKEQGFLD